MYVYIHGYTHIYSFICMFHSKIFTIKYVRTRSWGGGVGLKDQGRTWPTTGTRKFALNTLMTIWL